MVHGDFHVDQFTRHFLLLSSLDFEQYSIELATSPFWNSFFLACALRLAAVSHFLHRLSLSWTFAFCGKSWAFFSSYSLSWRRFSYSVVSPNKSQQNSRIYISFEFWTYLIPPLGFLTDISCAAHSKLQFGLPPPSLFSVSVNITTIHLAAQAHKVNHFICKRSTGQFH